MSHDRCLVTAVVVFDLDYTLWHPELYQLRSGPPFKACSDGCVLTARGERVDLFPAARGALRELSDAGIPVAIASRASERAWAEEIMRLMRVDEGRSMADIIGDTPVVIQGGSKVKHLRHISHMSGVPLARILFFDNERTNIQEVEKIGPTCIYCPRGFKDGVFRDGLRQFAGSTKSENGDDGGELADVAASCGSRARRRAKTSKGKSQKNASERKSSGRRAGRGR